MHDRAAPDRHIVVFTLQDQRFGLPAADVAEVLQAAAITALPHAPPIVEGVLDLRGVLVPVLDVRARFRVPPRALTASDHFIVARANERTVAIRVDRVTDLLTVTEAGTDSLGEVVPGAEYVAGVMRTADGLVLIHDLATFLSNAEQTSLDAVMGSMDGDGQRAE